MFDNTRAYYGEFDVKLSLEQVITIFSNHFICICKFCETVPEKAFEWHE